MNDAAVSRLAYLTKMVLSFQLLDTEAQLGAEREPGPLPVSAGF